MHLACLKRCNTYDQLGLEKWLNMIHALILFDYNYGYDYDDEKNILIGRKDISEYGFFATFTLLLISMMTVYKIFKRFPADIDGKDILSNLNLNHDIPDMYHHFFNINEKIGINFDEELPVPTTPSEHHTIYAEKNIKYFKPFFDRYFNLNENILNKIGFLKSKYNVNSDNSISIIYRDTDKWTDLGGFNYLCPAPYFRFATLIMEKNPDYKILIQTEDHGLKLFFQKYLKATFFDETLTSQTLVQPVFLEKIENKLEWAEYYMASLWIHSKSKYLISYTGNSSFFLYLNRGTTNNFFQEITFTKHIDEFFVKNN
jgi:hypothetical protein